MIPVRLSARPSATVWRPQPKTASAIRGLPSQYFIVISASKARRVGPVILDAASGSLRRTDVQEPLNAVVTRAYGFRFVLPYLFYSFRSCFQIILDHFPQMYYPSTIMSSLVTKWKKNKPYLYWVRSARVQGKPRIVEQIYLGPRERVLEQLRTQGAVAPPPGAAPPLRTVQTREFGASTLFYALAQDLGLIDLINAHVPPAPARRRTSLSVGHY